MKMKNYTMPTLQQRIESIKTLEDIDKQMLLAGNYAKYLRKEAKKAEILDEKLAINKLQEEAERIVRQLRMAIWDIEDSLKLAATA